MSQKALLIAKLLLYIGAAFLFFVLAIVAYRGLSLERSLQNDADEAHRVLLEAGLTAKDARKASADEEAYLNRQLPVITAQTEKTLSDADRLVTSLQGTSLALGDTARSATGILDAARTSVGDIGPLLQQTRETIAGLQPIAPALTQTIKDADALAKNPDIAASLRNVNDGTAQIAATAKDVREEVHALTHPKPLTQIVDWALKVAEAAGAWSKGIF